MKPYTLSYEECAALKAAGFPQQGDHKQYAHDPKGATRSKPAVLHDGGISETFAGCNWLTACPNSDELLAEIVRRWPDSFPTLWADRNPHNDLCADLAELRIWWNAGDLENDWVEGFGTPASALAALYCQLAKPAPQDALLGKE